MPHTTELCFWLEGKRFGWDSNVSNPQYGNKTLPLIIIKGNKLGQHFIVSLSLWLCSIISIGLTDSSGKPCEHRKQWDLFPFLKIFCLNAGRSTRSSQAGAEDNKPSSPWLCEPRRQGPAKVIPAALLASLPSHSHGGGSLVALPSALSPPAVGAPRGGGGG